MKVVEIFDSMQGEGEYMGIMCTFVRFAGCNLSCPFCDEAKKYSKAKEMSIEKIVKKCKQNTQASRVSEDLEQVGKVAQHFFGCRRRLGMQTPVMFVSR